MRSLPARSLPPLSIVGTTPSRRSPNARGAVCRSRLAAGGQTLGRKLGLGRGLSLRPRLGRLRGFPPLSGLAVPVVRPGLVGAIEAPRVGIPSRERYRAGADRDEPHRGAHGAG